MKPRTQPLRRTGPLAKAGPLRSISKQKTRADRQKRKMYDETRADECFSCGPGCHAELTPSHILTQGNHGRHRANALNLVWECWPMHMLWEHNKPAYVRQFPGPFAEKMRRMRKVDRKAYNEFRNLHDDLFTS